MKSSELFIDYSDEVLVHDMILKAQAEILRLDQISEVLKDRTTASNCKITMIEEIMRSRNENH